MLSSIVYNESHPRRSAARAAFCTSSIPSNSFSRTPAPIQSAVPQNRSITPLESTLIEVLILGNLKLFRMNTYAKHGRVTSQFPPCPAPSAHLRSLLSPPSAPLL